MILIVATPGHLQIDDLKQYIYTDLQFIRDLLRGLHHSVSIVKVNGMSVYFIFLPRALRNY